MATFLATTASNGPRLRNQEAARQVLERYYWDGDVQALIETDRSDGQAYLALYGYDWPGTWKIPHDVDREAFATDYDDDPDDGFAQFLLDIAPCLAEPLTVQAVGSEKCRFPLSACEWHIQPDGTEVEVQGFHHSCDEPALVLADVRAGQSDAAEPKAAGTT